MLGDAKMITCFEDFKYEYDEYYIAREKDDKNSENLYHLIWHNKNYCNAICEHLISKGFKVHKEERNIAQMRGNLTRVEFLSSNGQDDNVTQFYVEYFDGIGEVTCAILKRDTTLSDSESNPFPYAPIRSKKVFLVHGRDEKAKEAVKKTLIANGYEPIILGELVNRGATIIEKFERSSSEIKYAVVIYTPCDVGRFSTAIDKKYRARQNVVFEHGYFNSALGREKISILVKGDIELPSDISGILHIQMDAEGAWKERLISEIESSPAFHSQVPIPANDASRS